ncbi:MAG: HpsJ family protein [Xenococcaceae cyanobacterium MO_188.B29]|nr:HpsJ family protein [Xenococcaceae cyanobacterium MO_188.B29]
MTLSKSSSRKRKSKSRKTRNSRSPRIIQVATEKLARSIKMLPWIGYFILGLVLLDYVFLLIPPHFLNPTWELNIIGHLVENVWAPLLGFALVFIRQENGFKVLELRILSWLSRLMLLMAIIYFLSAPLIISNTIKIQQKSFSGLKTQLETQKNQVAQFKKQLSQVPDRQLANYLRQQQSSSNKSSSSDTLLQQALSKVEKEQLKSTEQIKKAYKKQKLSLIKRSLKWCMGTLFSGAIFFVFWKHTEWARKTSPN